MSFATQKLSHLIKKYGATAIGQRVGLSRTMISQVANEKRNASGDLRSQLTRYGIALSDWSTEETAVVRPPKNENTSISVAKLRGIDGLREAIAKYNERIGAMTDDDSATAWASVLRGKADASDRLAKLQGEGEITVPQIIRSKAWQEILKAIYPALEKHPVAARDIQGALATLET